MITATKNKKVIETIEMGSFLNTEKNIKYCLKKIYIKTINILYIIYTKIKKL